MKKFLMLSLVLTLLLTGCNAATTFGESITETTETTMTSTEITSTLKRVQTQIAGIYSLDQTPEEYLAALKEEGIILKPNPNFPDYPDGRTVEWDGSFHYDHDVIRTHFDPSGQMVGFSILTDRYPTELGLRVGDSKDQMLKLYGNDYQRDEYSLWYNYDEDDRRIAFRVEDNTIIEWDLYFPGRVGEEP